MASSGQGFNSSQKTYGAIDNDPIAIKNKLMDQISENISKLIESVGIIKRYIPKIGTNSDNTILRNSVQNVERESTQKLAESHKKVQELIKVVKQLDKLSQINGRTLSEQFREVVNEYNFVQRELSTKLKYAPLPKDPNQSPGQNEGDSQDRFESEVSQMLLQRNLQMERDGAVDRQIRMQQIEDDVSDVNQIMKELNAMVNQQGENIESIENAIDRAAGEVEGGHDELFTAYQRQRKKRIRKFICSSVILVVLVTGVLYLALSN